MMKFVLPLVLGATLCSVGWSQTPQNETPDTQAGKETTFGDDVEFLQKHKNVVVLKSENDSCQIAIVPDYLSVSLSEIDFTKAAQGSGNSDERSSVLVPRQESGVC